MIGRRVLIALKIRQLNALTSGWFLRAIIREGGVKWSV
jgi:hypothetical protein